MSLSNPLHGERRAGFVGKPLPGVKVGPTFFIRPRLTRSLALLLYLVTCSFNRYDYAGPVATFLVEVNVGTLVSCCLRPNFGLLEVNQVSHIQFVLELGMNFRC